MKDRINSVVFHNQPVNMAASSPNLSTLANEQSFDQAAELLKTLAHPLRIRIILLLTKKRSMNVSSLQRRLKVDQTILSYQLIRMRDRGLLDSTRQGKEIYYSLVDSALSEIMKLALYRGVLKEVN
ncbi:ArsR/SmtB family transcription factor [Spirosoma validum]|uniref:Winged helix-turn-helix transcriptional regulator n=1 Tax=Spirosoma validum TaxID=2771355 RepID=A0A927B7K9_9BACT|nr:metalloregulator ArsR/SmtB family transcription factor [Spirosoma validum]MBD2757204.1 winged helix-turn-helix transcriptional regulator [Spirosoma validum]